MICLCCGAESAHGPTCIRCGEASWTGGASNPKPSPLKRPPKKTAGKSKPGRRSPKRED
jgi:hypothetical protein